MSDEGFEQGGDPLPLARGSRAASEHSSLIPHYPSVLLRVLTTIPLTPTESSTDIKLNGRRRGIALALVISLGEASEYEMGLKIKDTQSYCY